MVEATQLATIEMLSLTSSENRRCRRWCALVILLAVCALTASVATRYSYTQSASALTGKTLQKHLSPEPSRQRLSKNAANWIPPVVRSVTLQAPSSYPRIAPAGPPMPNLVLENSLYNRPPPTQSFS
jgi:hypothetical protein